MTVTFQKCVRMASMAAVVAVLAGCGKPDEGSNSSAIKDVTDIESMYQQNDGRFAVTCRDGRRETVTAEQIKLGLVCQTTPSGGGVSVNMLFSGSYRNITPNSSICGQTLWTEVTNGTVTALEWAYRYPCNQGLSYRMSCDSQSCQSNNHSITPLGQGMYYFWQKDGSGGARFQLD